MKIQKTKKLFVFITVMMFFSLTQFAAAQKATGYPCRCGFRQYGCPPTNSACAAYCARRCGSAFSVKKINSKKNSTELSSRSTFIPIIILPSGNDVSKLFENAKPSIKLPANSENKLFNEIKLNTTPGAISN